MQSKRMYREIHVSTVGFNRGTLITCCFIPDCLLIKLEVGVLVLGRVKNPEKQGRRNYDPQVFFAESEA